MTRHQTTVIWIGLFLIAFNVIIHLADFKTVIFGGSANKTQGNPVQAPQGQTATPPKNQIPTPTPNPSPTTQVV